MAKINLVDEVVKHDDNEIIEFLTDEVGKIRMVLVTAVEKEDPALAYTAKSGVETVYGVLRELNRRNQEKAL